MKRFVIALMFLAGAGGRLSAEVRVDPPAFGTVRAGQMATIQWRGLARGVEELELLLTIEGRAQPVRVTPQLAARTGVLLWRVPNLPSRSARLTIRYGLDGEEIEEAPSAPFEILPAAGKPAMILFREGEWWTQEAAEDRFPAALDSHEDGGRMREHREGFPCAGSPSPTVPAPARTDSRGAGSRIFKDAASSARPVLSRRPAEVPARI